jgi:hypothetical protein
MVLRKLVIFTVLIFAENLIADTHSINKLKNIKKLENMLSIVNEIGVDSSKIDLTKEINQIKYYYKLKFSLILIRNKKIESSEKLFSSLKSIIEESDDFELVDEYDFDELNDIYEIEYDNWKKKKFNFEYFISLAFYTWNYSLELTDSNGQKASLYAKERGPCLGGGVRYLNALWGGESSLCYAYATSTIGEDSKSIKYNQNSVPVDAFIWVSNLLWRPKDQVTLKIGLPIIYHNGDYSAPTGGYIDDSNTLSYGYQIAGEWQYKRTGLEMAIGKFQNYPSSYWSFKLFYLFD